MPDSDEIQLRLQAYQLAIQQGTTPDTVYSWLTQEGTPGEKATLHVLYPTPDHDHDARVREQFDHPAGRGRTAPPAEPEPEPERNYLLPDAAVEVATAFLAAVRVHGGPGGSISLQWRQGGTRDLLDTVIQASGQADGFYGGTAGFSHYGPLS